MTTHQFFIKQSRIDKSRMVTIEGQDARHISQVLRLKKGSRIKLVDETQQLYSGTIRKVSAKAVLVALDEMPPCIPEQARVSVVQGIPRLPKSDLIVQKLTELGVGGITFVSMARSPYTDAYERLQRRLQRLESIAEAAAKQCGRRCIPWIRAAKNIKEALTDLSEGSICLAASENVKDKRLQNVLSAAPAAAPISVFIGPEGGFSEDELALLARNGAREFSLGQNILRTETAAIVAAALVLYELGEL
ncbi:MAG: 16S rRNA (uracil(1498)-N(3))-methyltransferase [Candidatus Abyssobacteria bacterium SURF_5]|uniref:Ribosomal RNA small subunit methyltransferase E n=1 Tax=Abyssobacteria bacterium (strain SURF_5) TaxID=2093360 RepID=A0A3A4NSM2_ABYX5|nr:MAG: 16S rRNA (uracil(1498)-N(3))-methyltransferase [Candidatus Abyssubacteria bacterium SURF_5]